MKTYTFNVDIGTDDQGNHIYKEFVIEAANFAEARHILTELVAQFQ